MIASRRLDNASKIIMECMALKDGVLAVKNNGFFIFRDGRRLQSNYKL